ncbi:TPA: hypothetical protein MJA52_003900 [Klebsiella aerogenes]|nr:hypothetical protein [Klebsiella aerogenes]
MMLNSCKKSECTAPKNLKAFGYRLGDDVYFIISERVLFNIRKKNPSRLQLRTTMSVLLEFLLKNFQRDFISDDEIMTNVWEANALRASSHRLWQVMRELKLKLNEIGLTEDIFYRSGRCGFIVSRDKVEPLYRKNNQHEDFI